MTWGGEVLVYDKVHFKAPHGAMTVCTALSTVYRGKLVKRKLK